MNSLVALARASALRTSGVVEERRRDRVDTDAAKHLAFGYGIHYCIGAALSRLEVPMALALGLDRFPGIRLEPGAPREWTPNITFRGLAQLIVRV
jgi:cytochrome P450